MDDIFLSYSREDSGKAEKLARMLKSHGYSVWWDRDFLAGTSIREFIREKIEASKCVVVLWSRHSVHSEWVPDEAQLGAKRGVLVPVLLDSAAIPLGFGQIHAEDFSAWPETTNDPGFKRLVRAISVTTRKLTPENQPERDPSRRATTYRQHLLAANTQRELQRLKYEADQDDQKDHPDIRMVRDDIDRALQNHAPSMGRPNAMGRPNTRHWKVRTFLVAAPILLVLGIGLKMLMSSFREPSDLSPTGLKDPQYRDRVRDMPKEKRLAIVEKAGLALHDEFVRFERTKYRREYDFQVGHVLIEFLHSVDPGNGSAFYYSGEKRRLLDDWTQPHFLEDFRGYLDAEEACAMKRGQPNCVDLPRGYSIERTAWIHHVIAVTWYRNACIASDGASRDLMLRNALRSLESERGAFPNGFNSADSGVPTEDLETLLRARRLSKQYCTESVRVLRPATAATVGPLPRADWYDDTRSDGGA